MGMVLQPLTIPHIDMSNEKHYDDGPMFDNTQQFYSQQRELLRQDALIKWNTHDPFVRASKELIEIIETKEEK